MTYKLILVTKEQGHHDEYECECSINVQEVDNFAEDLFVLAQQDGSLQDAVAELVLKILENPKDYLRYLADSEWVNKKEIKDRVEKAELGNKYFLYDHEGRYFTTLEEIDLNHMSDYDIERVVDPNTHIVRSVTKTSFKKFLSAAQKKKYDAQLRKVKAEKEKKAKATAERKRKKEEKELEKARKLLEKHGG